MPTKGEKDEFTNTELRDHEWDGIRELDNPLPRWWLYIFYATIAASVVYYILYPSWPGITGYTQGVLGYTERKALDAHLATARAAQAKYLDRIKAATPAEIRSDPELLNFALAGGKSAFADNCAPCHGPGGAGRPGYPSLADDGWIWGGTLPEIEKTLRHGIRWPQDDDTRVSEMPRFGADEVLTPDQIDAVTQHVLAMTDRATDPEKAKAGASIYAEQCASCHGPQGGGNLELGAPRLSDAIWLYGSSPEAIRSQIYSPSHGVMPAWVNRLDDATLKMLSVYVHSLGGGK